MFIHGRLCVGFPYFLALLCLIHSTLSLSANGTVSLVLKKDKVAEVKSQRVASLSMSEGDALSFEHGSLVLGPFTLSSSHRTANGNRVVAGFSPDGALLSLAYNAEGEMQGSVRAGNSYHRIFSDGPQIKMIEADGSYYRDPFDSGAKLPLHRNQSVATRSKRGVHPRVEKQVSEGDSAMVSYPQYKSGTAVLKMLIYYEETFSEDPSVVADFLIQQTNTYFTNSKIDIRVELAGLKALPIDPATLQEDVLSQMQSGEAPFLNIASDRSFYAADVVFALRENRPADDDACGIAYVGVQDGVANRNYAVSSVHWKPLGSSSDRTFCSDSTFAHELGHVLGSLHERRLYEEGEYGAYRFSFGHFTTGLQGWHTIMSYGDEPEYPYFSNPSVRECRYQPCGVAPDADGSADNATGFENVGHMLAGYAGEQFIADSLAEYHYERTCETDAGEDGFERGHAIQNNSPYELEIVSFTTLNSEGASSVTNAPDSIPPGYYYYRSQCAPNSQDNSFGSSISSSWFTYRNPETNDLVEGVHLPWEKGYTGDYFTVRVAAAEGGAVDGHTSRVIKSGQGLELNFIAEPGYELISVSGTCDSDLAGNTATVSAVNFDCRVEPTFEAQTASEDTLRVSLEEPVDGEVHSGVGNLRGWAVASSGIEKVEIFIDGVYEFDAPYGASRGDVGNAFPDVENSTNSGYSLSYAYSLLSAGEHTITAIAHSELGATTEVTNTFTVVKFPSSDYITDPDAVNLNSASCSVRDDEILLIDALVEDLIHDVTLKWRTAAQGFEIIEVR